MRPILIVGGAPRVPVDAVRYLAVAATGHTAVALGGRLAAAGHRTVELLLSVDAAAAPAYRFGDRAELELALSRWVAAHPQGVVVMSAAVNDYEVDSVEARRGGELRALPAGAKLPSGADEAVIRLRPAAKVIDQLRRWGLAGPIVGFKYESHETVLASAEALRIRVGAALVVANSLCGSVQSLVTASGVEAYPGREALLDALARQLLLLAGNGDA
jgi:hypothetical protein